MVKSKLSRTRAEDVSGPLQLRHDVSVAENTTVKAQPGADT